MIKQQGEQWEQSENAVETKTEVKAEDREVTNSEVVDAAEQAVKLLELNASEFLSEGERLITSQEASLDIPAETAAAVRRELQVDAQLNDLEQGVTSLTQQTRIDISAAVNNPTIEQAPPPPSPFKAKRKALRERTIRDSNELRADLRNERLEAVIKELYETLQRRSDFANALREKIDAFLKMPSGQERQTVAEVLEQELQVLIEQDESLIAKREEIDVKYSEAEKQMQQSVEQTMLRTGAFFVHTINEDQRLRHNANSNVAAEATFEDDLDLLLALEPSISSSSILPGQDEHGKVSGLWSESGGVLLSGGSIKQAFEGDGGSVSHGIKNRGSNANKETSIASIDRAALKKRSVDIGETTPGAHNEFVIDNPEISGYFKPGAVDEQGTFWADGLRTKDRLLGLQRAYQQDLQDIENFGRIAPDSRYKENLQRFQAEISDYRDRFNLIKGKGLPFYVMTPDRRLFEVFAVLDNGELQVGAELTPQEAARKNAGLIPERRKELGQRVLQKDVLRHERDREEAADIIKSLDTGGDTSS